MSSAEPIWPQIMTMTATTMTATSHDPDGHTTDSKLLTKMTQKLKEVNAVVWSI